MLDAVEERDTESDGRKVNPGADQENLFKPVGVVRISGVM